MLGRPFASAGLLALAVALAGCGAAADNEATRERVTAAKLSQNGDSEVTLSDATVRLNANPAAPSAAYFTVRGGDIASTITGVQSADIERAELHESMAQGGMMEMRPLADVDVPAGEEVRFRQGGLHVMLFGVSDAAREAGRLTLTVAFADGTTREIEAPLVSATGAAPAHAGH